MAFRGISLEPIHRHIQMRLEELKEQHSYFNRGNIGFHFEQNLNVTSGADAFLKLNEKTCWYSLRSNAMFQNDAGEYTEPLYNKLGPIWDNAQQTTVEQLLSGPNAVRDFQFRYARQDYDLTPPPGVEAINITNKGTLGSIKTADIKLRCFHPNDILDIERAYLMPGITLFLEWGWTGTTPIDTVTYESLKGKPAIELENEILRKKLAIPSGPLTITNGQQPADVLSLKPGQYDGMLGVITKFNWSLDSDGSYGINVSIISPNSLTMGVELETHLLNAKKASGFVWSRRKKKYIGESGKEGGQVVSKVNETPISDPEFIARSIKKILSLDSEDDLPAILPKYPMEYDLGLEKKKDAANARLNSKKKSGKALIKQLEKAIAQAKKRKAELIKANNAIQAATKAMGTAYATFNRTVNPLGVNAPYIVSNDLVLLKGKIKGTQTTIEHWYFYGPFKEYVDVFPFSTSPLSELYDPSSEADFLELSGGNYALFQDADEAVIHIEDELDFIQDNLPGVEKRLANAEAKLKRDTEKGEQEVKAIEEQQNAEVNAKAQINPLSSDGSFVLPGGKDKKFIYHASDGMGLFADAFSKTKYKKVKKKQIFFRNRNYSYLYAKPEAQFQRNGKDVRYWWQTDFAFSTSKQSGKPLTEGALYAIRGWFPSPDGENRITKDFVTWRFIEDVVLSFAQPREKRALGDGEEDVLTDPGFPVLTLSSTHVSEYLAEDESQGQTTLFPNQCVNHPSILSMDTNVCLLWDKQSLDHLDSLADVMPFTAAANKLLNHKKDYEKKCGGRFVEDVTANGESITTFGTYDTANIRDILVNVDHLISVLNSQRTFETMVTTLLNDINDSCGKPWDFVLQAHETDAHVLKVVDRNCTDSVEKENPNPYIIGRTIIGDAPISPLPKDNMVQDDEAIESNNKYGLKEGPGQPPAASEFDFKFQNNYLFKGKGVGNILKSVKMNSKLPKSVQTMAFISNKRPPSNTSEKKMNTFNIYGENIVDSFYRGAVTGKRPKKFEQQAQDLLATKQENYKNYVMGYRSLFTLKEAASKSSINIRQIQKNIINQLIYPNLSLMKSPQTKANVSQNPRLLPLELQLELDGISGIYQGNSLAMQTISDGGVLPDRYKDKVVFQITKVAQSISDSGWTTSLTCLMRMKPLED